ncbi:MAG: hypothetical protein ACRCZJ_07160 [Erysipelotrichaceae bacterium]
MKTLKICTSLLMVSMLFGCAQTQANMEDEKAYIQQANEHIESTYVQSIDEEAYSYSIGNPCAQSSFCEIQAEYKEDNVYEDVIVVSALYTSYPQEGTLVSYTVIFHKDTSELYYIEANM